MWNQLRSMVKKAWNDPSDSGDSGYWAAEDIIKQMKVRSEEPTEEKVMEKALMKYDKLVDDGMHEGSQYSEPELKEGFIDGVKKCLEDKGVG